MLSCVFFLLQVAVASSASTDCALDTNITTTSNGFQLGPASTFQHLGQYSPWYSTGLFSSPVLDAQRCNLTQINLLQRHGSRYPTSSASTSAQSTVTKLKKAAPFTSSAYAFLSNYTYNLTTEVLTTLGQVESLNSGVNFWNRYGSILNASSVPFIRASSSARVVMSAQNWTQGFSCASGNNVNTSSIVVLSEDSGKNDTLDPSTCNAFENGPYSLLGSYAQSNYSAIFTKPIVARVANTTGVNVTATDIINLFNLCAFETVAHSSVSPFCNLFSTTEFAQYDYYQDLGKWYGQSFGNPLGPAQGVGYVNELLARLTSTPVHDSTSTNSTLDSSATTFPLGRQIYADFSHDNPMTSMFSALGLYSGNSLPYNGTIPENRTFRSSRIVPFAGRAYIERWTCSNTQYVRIIVNDVTQPLGFCNDHANDGICTLDAFVKSQTFATNGTSWSQC